MTFEKTARGSYGARTPGAEREEAWRRVTQAQPRYTGYAKKTDRDIPIIRLEAAR